MPDFQLNPQLLSKPQNTLAARTRTFWVVGGACAGKTTVCQAIAANHGIPVYDMDEHIFGEYPGRCTAERHPALHAWFTAPDPLAWLLGLPPTAFEAFNKATTAEYLDLLADDLQPLAPDQPLLIDGGVTNPALLAQVMPAGRIACLEISEALSVRAWEEDADRQFMKEMVLALPDPDAAWRKFLHFDALIWRTMLRESSEMGIRIFPRDEDTSLQTLVDQIVRHLGIDEC